jgi:hypothetical protein
LVADPRLLGRGQTVAGSGVTNDRTAGKTFQKLSLYSGSVLVPRGAGRVHTLNRQAQVFR